MDAEEELERAAAAWVAVRDQWHPPMVAPPRLKRLLDAVLIAGQPLVQSVARNMQVPSWCDRGDLAGAGQFGLIHAAHHFDPTRGVTFGFYARQKIWSRAREEIRSADWVPKRVREEGRRLEEADLEARAIFGRPGTDDEIAELLKVTKAELAELRIRQIGSKSVPLGRQVTTNTNPTTTLNGTLNGKTLPRDVAFEFDVPIAAVATTENVQLVNEIERRVAEAITGIDDVELKVVLLLRYAQGLSMTEIAGVLGCSKAKVSKLVDAALDALAERISAST